MDNEKNKIASPKDKKLWTGTDKPAGEIAAKPPREKLPPQTSVIKESKKQEQKEQGELNTKQRKFVEEYFLSGNITDAAKKAGYLPDSAHVTGSRLLKNAKVRKYLVELQRGAAERVLISKEEILKDLIRVKERCLQEVEPLTDKKGEALTTRCEDGASRNAFVFDSNGVVKALDMAAKLLGMYPAEKKDITVNKPVLFEGEDEL